jgi:nicotinate-nucleotide--dimethylbenzimidazole phosphoribosyltransferase
MTNKSIAFIFVFLPASLSLCSYYNKNQMRHFQIHSPEEKIKEELQYKIDNLTKPKGSLGRLEELAAQVGLIQQTLSPVLNKPHNIIFAADHGITEENVSVSPKEVTWQQCIHFLKSNGGGVNFLCRQHGFTLQVVDAGVDYDFSPDTGIIQMKVRKGTRNYAREAAMTMEEMELCIDNGAAIVRDINAAGCNVVSFGEMGIGNTSSSSLWMTCLTNIPLLQCVGAGSGLSNEGIRHKYQVLKKALDNYHGDRSAKDVMRYFGGYEMVMAVGAMLQAAELKMIILVDGFIMTNCILAASHLYPEVLSYAVFGHCGDESGHIFLLEALNAHPLLNLGMRLGEGTGAICAYPILESAVRMINEMSSFEGGKVTKYF